MVRKILFIGIAVLIAVTSTMFLPGLAIDAVLASNQEVDAFMADQALAATVQIQLLAVVVDEQGQPVLINNNGDMQMQYQSGEGLGTLVRKNNELVILTHDHWTMVNDQLTKARFYNASNELLAEVSGPEFLSLVQSRNGGTMVLSVPAGFMNNGSLAEAPTSNQQAVNWGDAVAVVYRNPQTWNLEVRMMVIRDTADYHNHPSVVLQSTEDTIVVPGNSGGGIWFNGELVGNMWTTMVSDNLENGSTEALSMSRGAVLAW